MICRDATINTTFFSADCGEPNPEIVCTCCHLCCHDSNATCNNFDWRVNLDGIWEYDFQRVVYSFSQNLLPSEAKADYAQPEAQTGAQPEAQTGAQPEAQPEAQTEAQYDDTI